MSRVFISYRRGPASPYAGRLYDGLCARFGAGRVFMDVDNIAPGEDFVDNIRRAVASCDAILVLIGEEWLACRDHEGTPRLDDPNDFVRLEVGTGLERGIRVVPVLVAGAEMPTASELPPELAALAQRNAIELSDVRWHDDMRRLLDALQPVVGGEAAAPAPPDVAERATGARRIPSPAVIGVAVAAAAFTVAVLVLVLGGGGDSPPADAGSRPAAASARTETIAVESDPWAAVAAFGAVWVSNAGDGSVSRIDPAAGATVGRPIEVGANTTFLAAGESALWVVEAGGDPGLKRGHVHRIDPAAGQIAGSPIRVGRAPAGVAVGDGSVWVGNQADATLTEIDERTGRVAGTYPVGVSPYWIAYAAGKVWIPDRANGEVVTFDVERGRVDDSPILIGRKPDGIAAGAGAVWVADGATDQLFRIDPERRRPVGKPIAVGRNPSAVGFGEGAVWVSNHKDDTVSRVDPASGRVVGRPVPVGTGPLGLSAAEGSAWVANFDAGTVTRIRVR